MDFTFTDKDGSKKPLYLASYGIGITRVMGVIAEMMSDEKGLMWHASIAPFTVYLATIGNVAGHADKLYDELNSAGIDVLYDDRDARPGETFADADLMGIPFRLVISERTIAENQVEFKSRTEDESELVAINDISHYIAQKISEK